MMKKMLIWITVLTLMLSGLVLPTGALAPLSLQVSGEGTVTPGGTVTCRIVLSDTLTAVTGSVEVVCGEQMEIVSGEWLLPAGTVLSDFGSLGAGDGVFTYREATALPAGAVCSVTLRVLESAPLGDLTARFAMTLRGVDDAAVATLTEEITVHVVAPTVRKYGDVDDSGTVDVNDAVYILRYAARLDALDEIQLRCADTNADGTVDERDAVVVLRYAAGFDEPLGGPLA